MLVCFGRENNLRSKLIQKVTRSQWSHVWAEIKLPGSEKTWVIHSAADGVVLVPDRLVRPHYCAIDTLGVKVQDQTVVELAHSFVGAGYDFGVISNGFLLVLYNLTGLKPFDPIRNGTKFSCSELITTILKLGGMEGLSDMDPELTTPGMLFDRLVSLQ